MLLKDMEVNKKMQRCEGEIGSSGQQSAILLTNLVTLMLSHVHVLLLDKNR